MDQKQISDWGYRCGGEKLRMHREKDRNLNVSVKGSECIREVQNV